MKTWQIASCIAMAMLVGSASADLLALQQRPDLTRFNEINRAVFKAPDELQAYQIVSSAYQDPELQPLRELLVQLLANQNAMVGRYREAEALAFSKSFKDAYTLPNGITAIPAASAILEMAGSHRVVMLNEAHTNARSRLLTYELLAPLRKVGFTHLALETLSSKDPINVRGYPVRESGYYTGEPVLGEITRQALALGYVLVPYEYNGDDPSQQARETGQAKNLAALLHSNPDARVLVHAGHAHINKDSRYMPDDAKSMAAELTRLTGIQPFSIEQTMMWDHPDPAKQHPLYKQALSLWNAQHDGENPKTPFVLLKTDGQLWAQHPPSNDVTVFMAPWSNDQQWRELGGLRHRAQVRNDPCTAYPCLIEARYRDESDQAVPADRQLLDAPGPITLWLRNGCYRITALPDNTRAEGEVRPVCFNSSADPASATLSTR